MLLSDILEYIGSVFLDDRTDLVDGDADSLWSDETIVKYLNEGQRILCRRAWVIIETGVAPAGIITLQTGITLYKLHKSVLRVFDATPSTQAAPLGRTTDLALRDPYPAGLDAFDRGEAAALDSTTDTGAPIGIATDAGTRRVRVYPTPTSTQNGVQMSLKIARMPITFLTLDDTSAEPEVPEEMHMALCDYAAGRCLALPDVDFDTKKEGRDILASFYQQVREFRQDRQRAEHATGRWAFDTITSKL